jgi:hypothetical protein
VGLVVLVRQVKSKKETHKSSCPRQIQRTICGQSKKSVNYVESCIRELKYAPSSLELISQHRISLQMHNNRESCKLALVSNRVRIQLTVGMAHPHNELFSTNNSERATLQQITRPNNRCSKKVTRHGQ